MKIQNIVFSLVVGLFLLGFALPVFAQSPSTAPRQQRVEDRQETRQDMQEQRQENREERVERRCELVNNQIDARITRYNKNYDEVEARIARTNERMNELADRLALKGYDVAKVRSDIQTLEGMKATRRAYYTAFIQKLETTKKYDCGDSEGAFKTALAESKTALASYRDQVKANWNFVTNILKPDLQALKGQAPSPTTTE